MRVIFTLLFFCCFFGLSAQSDFIHSPRLVSSSGGTLMEENYILNFSIGELATPTIDPYQTGNSGIILTQGFHQANYEITDISEIIHDYEISIFPNPTQSGLTIFCKIPNQRATLSIKDIKGNIVYPLSYFWTNEIQLIELNPFSQGIYFVEILLNSKEKIIYQIQKIN